jgi:hypothetical protein
MNSYVTIKTKTGIDIVGVLLEEATEFVIIDNPLEIDVHPKEGLCAKSFLLLSEQTSILLNRDDIFYVQIANEKAIEYYEEFCSRILKLESVPEDDYEDNDLEEMFNTMIESKTSIKH